MPNVSNKGELKAGVAKVEIEIPDLLFPYPHMYSIVLTGVHDPLHVRTLILDNGIERAAIVVFELIAVPFAEEIVTLISKFSGAPDNNIIVTAVHTHEAPFVDLPSVDANDEDERLNVEKMKAWSQAVKRALVDSINLALDDMQPARIGFGKGICDININRIEKFADGWFLGTNQYAPSDKTLAVMRVDKADGSPMAFFINYAVHAVVMHQSLTDGEGGMLVSADLPGETSRFIENWYDGKAVALWTSGAAGDQDPIFMCERHTAKRNGDHTSIKEHNRGYFLMEEQGERLAREALKVSETIETDARVSIASQYKVVTCPGQTGYREQPLPKDFEYKDGPPVDLNLSLLKINDIALTGINGELFSSIGQHLKEDSPLKNTVVINHTPGGIGYIPDDFGYECRSFEARIAKVKRGHAEKLIIGNVKAMIKELL